MDTNLIFPDNTWRELLSNEMQKDYFINLMGFVNNEYENKIIYPAKNNIFNALKLTDYKDVKAVILGQDPYINVNQAHGLAFSVESNPQLPPSLKNIYKELHDDMNISVSNCGNLTCWAQSGILLLNTVLTVEAGKSLSHKDKGWEIFTDAIIKLLNMREKPIVFILWGSNAIKKKVFITNPAHYILTSPHPSPLSAHGGFFGCRHFSKTNQFLMRSHLQPIDWEIKKI